MNVSARSLALPPAVVLLFLTVACKRIPDRQPPAERPSWLKDGIVMVGSWEPLTFLLRRGGQEADAAERWRRERKPESVRRLKELGVNLAIVNFHKGFGIKTEAADIEATRAFVQLAHSHGIKVGGYIGCTMFYETFFSEEPGARDWMQVDEWGHPIYYNREQTFRYRACFNNPNHQAFIRNLLRIGIRDLKLDLIHFDGIQPGQEPDACRCRHCRKKFQEFLRRRYADDSRRTARFGFTRLDDLGPPPYDLGSGAVEFPELKNPLMQEWALFRAANWAELFGMYDGIIRGMNPEVAVENNPNLNMAEAQGVDVEQLLRHGDIIWSEDPNYASWKNGRLVTKARNFKAARIMGKSVFVYTGGRYGTQDPDSPPVLRLAEAMAYNGANLGMVGDLGPNGTELGEQERSYVRFFREHTDLFRDSVSEAEVAMLRSFPSVMFHPGRCLPSTVLFEQALLQSQIPFDIVFDGHVRDLQKYKVLVMANQDAISDEQAEAIRAFVKGGGALVATGSTSMLTEWRLRRDQFALADLFGIEAPPKPGEVSGPRQREFGRGRVVYVPAVEPSIEPPRPRMSYTINGPYWALPANTRNLVESVRWAAGGRLAVEVDAPPSVTVELTAPAGSKTWLLHLVNFDFRNTVSNIEVRLRPPDGFDAREAVVETPDGPAPEKLQPRKLPGAVSFRIPQLRVYSLVRIDFTARLP